jgi:hypothetical protein
MRSYRGPKRRKGPGGGGAENGPSVNWAFVPPMLPSGKVLKRVLRDQARAGAG